MSKCAEKALELHAKGYNCAQAVVCAFKDKLDTDEKVLYKIAEGFNVAGVEPAVKFGADNRNDRL